MTDWDRFVALHEADQRLGQLVARVRGLVNAEGRLLQPWPQDSPQYAWWSEAAYHFRQWQGRQEVQREARELRERLAAPPAPVADRPAPISDREGQIETVKLVMRLVEALDEAARYAANGGLAFDAAGHPRSPVKLRAQIGREAASLLARLLIPPASGS